jgi:hypothetical protein
MLLHGGWIARRLLFALALLVLAALSGQPADAHVTRVEFLARQDVLGGRPFGATGAYERITGRVYFSVEVADPHNAPIVDLANAVNLHDGAVEFSADFVALRPKQAARANGSVLLEIPNRGRARIVSLIDGGDTDLAGDAGDGWLLRNGFTVVTLGWQWDAAGKDALRLYAPVAREGGKPITGVLRGDVMLSHDAPQIPLGHLILEEIGGTEYAVADANDPRNTLTVRASRDAPRTTIPRSQWRFAQSTDGRLIASDRYLHLEGGFRAGQLYEYTYVVADPVVAGLGFAAVRDFAAYLKRAPDALVHGERVYGEGISQNGRFLRDFVYEGFNADESGKRALDGVLAHVAGAGRGSFNYRFAQPSRDAQPTSAVFFPTDVFPFTDTPEQDQLSGEHGSLLERAAAAGVVPKIFLSNTSYEYWGRAAALIHVDADGKADAPVSADVRIYHFTGLQHFSGPFPPARGQGDLKGQAPQSPLPIRYFWRAMITNMDAWVREGREPPASRYPRIADGTLVSLRDYAFPSIPGVARPHEASEARRLDFGPHWRAGILSVQPPRVGESFPVLVPQVDADGNERDGVRLPEVAVPLATYAPWNLRDPSIGAPGERVAFEASYLPFPKTAEERRSTGDPRRSIAERYRNFEEYRGRFAAAVDDLVKQRWIVPEDRDSLIGRAEREWQEATAGGGP